MANFNKNDRASLAQLTYRGGNGNYGDVDTRQPRKGNKWKNRRKLKQDARVGELRDGRW